MSIRCGYCGPSNVLPPGYDYLENRNICLRKGFGSGASVERRKWQRKLGLRIDPPYVSPCPKKDRSLIRQIRRNNRSGNIRRNRRSRSRSPSPLRNRSNRRRSRSRTVRRRRSRSF